MTAKGPVIIFVVDGGRNRDKRSGGGGGGFKAISDWQEVARGISKPC